jgi:IS5 family transposase
MGVGHLPDEIAFLGFRQLLEVHHLSVQILATINATLTAKGLLLRQGAVIDGTPIAAPPSTRNSTSTRDPEMRQTKRGISGATVWKPMPKSMQTRDCCTA